MAQARMDFLFLLLLLLLLPLPSILNFNVIRMVPFHWWTEGKPHNFPSPETGMGSIQITLCGHSIPLDSGLCDCCNWVGQAEWNKDCFLRQIRRDKAGNILKFFSFVCEELLDLFSLWISAWTLRFLLRFSVENKTEKVLEIQQFPILVS